MDEQKREIVKHWEGVDPLFKINPNDPITLPFINLFPDINKKITTQKEAISLWDDDNVGDGEVDDSD
ncbi:MAG: hypothetical protein ACTSRU_12935 [Candidatus Hodarchaeales archaeon]